MAQVEQAGGALVTGKADLSTYTALIFKRSFYIVFKPFQHAPSPQLARTAEKPA